jgi:uncharacterized protein
MATTEKSTPEHRGFAAMDEEKQREIASKGGKAAHEKGTAHEFTPAEASEAGKKGGEAVSSDREHMADIGKKGGEARGSAQHAGSAQHGSAQHGSAPGSSSGATGSGSSGSGATRVGTGEQQRKAGEQSHKKS